MLNLPGTEVLLSKLGQRISVSDFIEKFMRATAVLHILFVIKKFNRTRAKITYFKLPYNKKLNKQRFRFKVML